MAIIKEVSNEVSTNSTETSLMTMVMDLKRELQELKSKDKPASNVKDKKVHYKWPLAFSYKLWDWEPVLDYTSVKKESTRPLVFRSASWDLIDNHNVELTTTSWVLKKPVLLYDFTMWFERSEKMPAWAILKDGTEIKLLEIPKHVSLFEDIERFVFDTEEFGQIKVSPKIIN